jgi:hypothetical protein
VSDEQTYADQWYDQINDTYEDFDPEVILDPEDGDMPAYMSSSRGRSASVAIQFHTTTGGFTCSLR